VPFSSKLASLSIPSKTFDFLAAGLPLIIVGEGDTELAKLVKNFNNGKVFLPTQLFELSNYLTTLINNKEELELKSINSIKSSAFYSVDHVKMYLKK
jgi:hypothetical protein